MATTQGKVVSDPTRTYLKIGYAARLLCRFLARPSLYVYVLSRDSLRALIWQLRYSACSPHFEIRSSLMKTPVRIAPSLLSADFSRLGDAVRAVIEAHAD